MKNVIRTSDLHLTDIEADQYRFEIFPFLRKMQKVHSLNNVVICGDLVDRKDNHPARLTNRIVEEIEALADEARVFILMGNHDYYLRGHPFFKFLQKLNNVWYIEEPFIFENNLFMPYSRHPHDEWDFNIFNKKYEDVYIHQTFAGAVASNGEEMTGELYTSDIKLRRGTKGYSGDIHKPQQCDQFTYIGSPFHVHFGDRFEPRCIITKEDGKDFDTHLCTVEKFSIKIKSIQELYDMHLEGKEAIYLLGREQVQLKIELELNKKDRSNWLSIKKEIVEYCKEHGILLEGLKLKSTEVMEIDRKAARNIRSGAAKSREHALIQFAEHENIGKDYLEKGLEFIK